MVSQQPYVEYLLVDDSGSLTTRRYHVVRGSSIEQAQSAATSLRATVAALSGCSFVHQAVVYTAVEPTAGDPLPGADVWRVGTFVFDCAEPGTYAILLVPGIRDELLLPDGPWAGRAINQEHPAVVALVAALVGTFCNPFGQPIATLRAAFLQVQVGL